MAKWKSFSTCVLFCGVAVGQANAGFVLHDDRQEASPVTPTAAISEAVSPFRSINHLRAVAEASHNGSADTRMPNEAVVAQTHVQLNKYASSLPTVSLSFAPEKLDHSHHTTLAEVVSCPQVAAKPSAASSSFFALFGVGAFVTGAVGVTSQRLSQVMKAAHRQLV